jgi:hypothetical protein
MISSFTIQKGGTVNMAQVREMLDQRRDGKSVEDWAIKINETLSQSGKDERVYVSTLNSYVNGYRNMTSAGVRPLAVYFHTIEDWEMVDAITQFTLGIPYKDGHKRAN